MMICFIGDYLDDAPICSETKSCDEYMGVYLFWAVCNSRVSNEGFTTQNLIIYLNSSILLFQDLC